MLVHANFLTSLVGFAKQGEWLGVMVIDETESFSDHALLIRQVNVLHIARKQGWPIWFITLKDKPLHSVLRAAAPKAVTYTKPRGDAFEVQAFCHAVALSRVRRIVVMGHTATQCVRLSAVGGSWKPGDQPTPGATGSGYEVLTCQEIISGDVGEWKNNVGVFFYEGYLPPKPVRKL
jgi:hypothetical protein